MSLLQLKGNCHRGCVNKDLSSLHLCQQCRAFCNSVEITMALTHLQCMLDIALSLCAACVSAHKGKGHTEGHVPQALPPVQQLPCCSGPQTSPAAHTHSQTSTGCFHAHCTVVRTNPSCRCQPCRRRTALAGCRECRASPDCSVNMKGCLVC